MGGFVVGKGSSAKGVMSEIASPCHRWWPQRLPCRRAPVRRRCSSSGGGGQEEVWDLVVQPRQVF